MFIRLTEYGLGGVNPVLLPVCNITGITEGMNSRYVYLKEEYDGKKRVSVQEPLDYIEKELNKLLKD